MLNPSYTTANTTTETFSIKTPRTNNINTSNCGFGSNQNSFCMDKSLNSSRINTNVNFSNNGDRIRGFSNKY